MTLLPLNERLEQMRLSVEERKQRQADYNRMVGEDIALVQSLILDRVTLASGNPVTADRIRTVVFWAAEAYGLTGVTFPRGYRVLGNGGKTPYYFQLVDGSRPQDAQIVADAMSGWLLEVAEFLNGHLGKLQRQQAQEAK